MNKKECPYIYEDCKRKGTKCLSGYQSCQEWRERYLADMKIEETGIGAMVDFNHVINGRFVK